MEEISQTRTALFRSCKNYLQKLLAVRSHRVLSRVFPTNRYSQWNSFLFHFELEFDTKPKPTSRICGFRSKFRMWMLPTAKIQQSRTVGRSPTKYCKDCGRKWPWPHLTYYSIIYLVRWGSPGKISVSLADLNQRRQECQPLGVKQTGENKTT